MRHRHMAVSYIMSGIAWVLLLNSFELFVSSFANFEEYLEGAMKLSITLVGS